MKLIRVILATSATLVAFSPLQAVDANTTGRAWQWVAHYYENPRPDDFLSSVHALSRSDYFESVGQPAIALGFFATVFAQNPQKVSYWLAQTSTLPERHRRLLAAAAWKSGHPAGARLVQQMSAETPEVRAEVRQLLLNGSEPVLHTPVVSASSMNFQWGAFLASGDERCILNVLTALGSDRPGLANSARFALAQNAAAHPRVLAICRAQLDRQPESVRAELKAALNQATATKPGA
jgi:hypothetical protein